MSMSSKDIESVCSLEEILAARDARHERQMQLLQAYPDNTLICLTVVMPGEKKCNALTSVIGTAACCALKNTFGKNIFSPLMVKEGKSIPNITKTGFEAFFLVSVPTLETKRLTVDIEDNHTLGRLFDIDVIGRDGVPISRTQVGATPRQCLLCHETARVCMRKHTHTYEQLMAKVEEIVAAWQDKGEK